MVCDTDSASFGWLWDMRDGFVVLIFIFFFLTSAPPSLQYHILEPFKTLTPELSLQSPINETLLCVSNKNYMHKCLPCQQIWWADMMWMTTCFLVAMIFNAIAGLVGVVQYGGHIPRKIPQSRRVH
jgi:hypothetical protein